MDYFKKSDNVKLKKFFEIDEYSEIEVEKRKINEIEYFEDMDFYLKELSSLFIEIKELYC